MGTRTFFRADPLRVSTGSSPPNSGYVMPYLVLGTNASTRSVDIDFDDDFFFEFYAPLARGEPLTDELLARTPSQIFVRPPERGAMPDMFGANLGVWFVSERVRSVIEDLEPNIHAFIPVSLRVRGKSKAFTNFYILNIETAIDAVVIDETDFRDGHGRAGFEKAAVLNTLVGETVLDKRLIAGRHLWRGGRATLGGGGDRLFSYVFCSDDLAERLKSIGADGWRLRQCRSST